MFPHCVRVDTYNVRKGWTLKWLAVVYVRKLVTHIVSVSAFVGSRVDERSTKRCAFHSCGNMCRVAAGTFEFPLGCVFFEDEFRHSVH